MPGLLEGFKIGQELIPSIGDAVQLQGQMARSKLYNEYVKDAQMQREMTGAFRAEIAREGAVPKATPLAESAQPDQEWQGVPYRMPDPAPPPDPRDVALQSWQQRKVALTRQKNMAIPYAGSVPIAKSQYDIADKELKEMDTREKDAEKDITDLQGRLQKSVEEGFYTEAHATQLYKDHIAANPILDMKYGKQVKDVKFTAKGTESTSIYTAEEIAGSPALREEAARAGVTKLEPGKQYKWTSHHTPQGVKFTKLETSPSIEKSQTEDQRIDTALHDPDPAKRKRAQEVLDVSQGRKVDLVRREAEVRKGAKKDEEEGYSLATAPEGMKRTAKLLAEYKINLPSGFALRQPYWQNVLSIAEEIDPTFDATQYNVRMGVKKSFTSGKEGQNITGLNTAVGHINSLVKAAKDLDNSNWPSANYATNIMSKYLPITSGLVDRQGKITAVKTKFNAVKGEMASIFKRSGATDQEIKSWESTVDDPTTATKPMWKNFIAGSIELMGSRVGALKDQWEKGTGKPKDFHFLSPESRSILTNIGVDVNKIDPVGLNQPTGNQSVSRAEYFKAMKLRNPDAPDAEINKHLDDKGIK